MLPDLFFQYSWIMIALSDTKYLKIHTWLYWKYFNRVKMLMQW